MFILSRIIKVFDTKYFSFFLFFLPHRRDFPTISFWSFFHVIFCHAIKLISHFELIKMLTAFQWKAFEIPSEAGFGYRVGRILWREEERCSWILHGFLATCHLWCRSSSINICNRTKIMFILTFFLAASAS